MARSYFSDQECRDIGFSPPMIETLKKAALIVDAIQNLTQTQTDVNTVNGQVAVLDADLTTTAALAVSNEGRLDAIEALEPFVQQDQTAAWTAATGTAARTALASYGGQTVSNPPTQAEMQTLDDAVKAISQHLVALINDLRGNGALT